MMFISRAKNSCLAQAALERFLVFWFLFVVVPKRGVQIGRGE